MNEIEVVCDGLPFPWQILLSGNPRSLPAEHGKRTENYSSLSPGTLRLKE
jgi:hypothetical protein